MAFGGICGSLLGGYALNNLKIKSIFLLFAVLPTIQLLSCGLVAEDPVGTEVLLEPYINGYSSSSDEEGFSLKKSRRNISRRKKNQKKKKKKKNTFAYTKLHSPKKTNSLVVQWYSSLKEATITLYYAFKQPAILR